MFGVMCKGKHIQKYMKFSRNRNTLTYLIIVSICVQFCPKRSIQRMAVAFVFQPCICQILVFLVRNKCNTLERNWRELNIPLPLIMASFCNVWRRCVFCLPLHCQWLIISGLDLPSFAVCKWINKQSETPILGSVAQCGLSWIISERKLDAPGNHCTDGSWRLMLGVLSLPDTLFIPTLVHSL